MLRTELHKKRTEDAADWLLSTQEGADWAVSATPEDRREMLKSLEQELSNREPEKYSTQYTDTYYRRSSKISEKKSVPLLDYESDYVLDALSLMDESELDQIGSAELAQYAAAFPIDEVYPDLAKKLKAIGKKRTGISDNANNILSFGRGAIPFGGDLMGLTEEEIGSLVLQDPGFIKNQTAASIGSMFVGSGAGFKLIGKLDKIGKGGKVGLNLLKEGAIGAAYADTAPGFIASIAGQPDNKVLNFAEAAIIAGIFDIGLAAGKTLISRFRGKTIEESRNMIAGLLEDGTIQPEIVDRLPDNLKLAGPEVKALTDSSAEIQKALDAGIDPIEVAAVERDVAGPMPDVSGSPFGIVSKPTALQGINAAAGALGGYSLGETPEEKFELAIAGAFLASTGTQLHPAQLGLVKNAGEGVWKNARGLVGIFPADKVKAFWKKQLKRGMGMPEELFKIKEARDGAVQEFNYTLRNEVMRVKRELKKTFPGGLDDKTLKQFNAVMAGQDVPSAPEVIHNVANKWRAKITEQSKRLKPYVGSDDLRVTIDKNMNTYIHRSYQMFDDQNWLKKVHSDPELQRSYNEALTYMKNAYAEEGQEYAEEALRNELDSMIDAAGKDQLSGISEIGMGNSILKHRKDIPEPFRKVMGEYKDPFVNFEKTMAKIGNYIENRRMVSKMDAAGDGTHFFDDPKLAPPLPDGQSYQKIGGNFDTISEKYAAPDVADAMRTMGELEPLLRGGWSGGLFRGLLKLKGLVQMSKTVGSIKAHERNFQGGALWALAGGNPSAAAMTVIAGNAGGATAGALMVDEDDSLLERLTKIGTMATIGTLGGYAGARALAKVGVSPQFSAAFDVVANNVLERGIAEHEKQFAKYLKLNIVESSATLNEVSRVLKDARAKGYTTIDKISEFAPVKKLFDVYSGNDDMFKIMVFEGELKKLKAAYGTSLPLTELERMAAEVAKDIMPIYGRTGKLIQEIRRIPFFGNFVSFPAEIIRNSANIIRRGIKEVQTPELRKIGLERLGWFALGGVAAAPGLAAASRMWFGVSKDEDNAIGEMSAPWDRNANRLYLPDDTNGDRPKRRYINLDYTFPGSYAWKWPTVIYNELTRPGDVDERMLNAAFYSLSEAVEPFLSQSIVSQTIQEAMVGTTESGKRIYNRGVAGVEDDTWDERFLKGAIHILSQSIPTSVSDVSDLFNANKEQTLETFEITTGLRPQVHDPLKSFEIRVNGYSGNTRNNKIPFGGITYDANTTAGNVVEEYQKTNERILKQQQQLYRAFKLSVGMGVDPDEMKRVMKERGISRRDIALITTGRFSAYRPSRVAQERYQKQGKTDWPSARLIEIYGELQGQPLFEDEPDF